MNPLSCSKYGSAENVQSLKADGNWNTNYRTVSFLAVVNYLHVFNTIPTKAGEPAAIPETSV